MIDRAIRFTISSGIVLISLDKFFTNKACPWLYAGIIPIPTTYNRDGSLFTAIWIVYTLTINLDRLRIQWSRSLSFDAFFKDFPPIWSHLRRIDRYYRQDNNSRSSMRMRACIHCPRARFITSIHNSAQNNPRRKGFFFPKPDCRPQNPRRLAGFTWLGINSVAQMDPTRTFSVWDKILFYMKVED